jgi:hypothetical protein
MLAYAVIHHPNLWVDVFYRKKCILNCTVRVRSTLKTELHAKSVSYLLKPPFVSWPSGDVYSEVCFLTIEEWNAPACLFQTSENLMALVPLLILFISPRCSSWWHSSPSILQSTTQQSSTQHHPIIKQCAWTVCNRNIKNCRNSYFM